MTLAQLDVACTATEHRDGKKFAVPDMTACRRAADIFRALGEPARLRLLALLMRGELCVTEIATALHDSLPAVSQRLKLLRTERIVVSRRAGKHIYYRLADLHVEQLIRNALAHASESR